MENLIYRSIVEPIRKGLSWNERWKQDDYGLISCWESGRALREKGSELSRKAENGELPVLGWKGGVEKMILKGEKYGSFNYLAKWQGLRGEDLHIDISKDVELICSKTEMRIIYTSDPAKYGNV